jgi:hypothetical protein
MKKAGLADSPRLGSFGVTARGIEAPEENLQISTSSFWRGNRSSAPGSTAGLRRTKAKDGVPSEPTLVEAIEPA